MTWSTGPPGADRPASVSGGSDPAGPGWPLSCAATVASANGPAAPVTPGSLRVAARSAGVARDWFTTTARCAPCCAANDLSNGALESTTRDSASTDAPVEMSRTRPMTNVCTRRRVTPPRTARTTGLPFIAAPAGCPCR